MLGALFLADAAVLAVGEQLALALDVLAHHVLGVILEAIDVIVRPHLEDLGDIDIGGARLAILTAPIDCMVQL